MSVPSSRRKGLRRVRAVTRIAAGVFCAGAALSLVRVFTVDAEPLNAAGALYGATVAYGLGEMAALRERHLFRPGRPPEPHSALAWWAVRIVLVLGVSTLPAVLVLGGLTRR